MHNEESFCGIVNSKTVYMTIMHIKILSKQINSVSGQNFPWTANDLLKEENYLQACVCVSWQSETVVQTIQRHSIMFYITK